MWTYFFFYSAFCGEHKNVDCKGFSTEGDQPSDYMDPMSAVARYSTFHLVPNICMRFFFFLLNFLCYKKHLSFSLFTASNPMDRCFQIHVVCEHLKEYWICINSGNSKLRAFHTVLVFKSTFFVRHPSFCFLPHKADIVCTHLWNAGCIDYSSGLPETGRINSHRLALEAPRVS